MLFTRISIQRPVFASMLMFACLVLGLFGLQRLNVDHFPDVNFPVVVIQTHYPGASPESVEQDVSQPIEEAVNSLEGIKTVLSRSFSGASTVIAEFDLKKDAQLAAQEVRDKMSQVRPTLPDDVEEPIIARFNPEDRPVISLAITSPLWSPATLHHFADNTLLKTLRTVGGVGDIRMLGALERVVAVHLDPEALQEHRVTASEVLDALKTSFQEVPLGTLNTGPQEIQVTLYAKETTLEALRDVVISGSPETPVFLRDVAQVSYSTKSKESSAFYEGQPALGLEVVKIRGSNTPAVVDAIKAHLASFESAYPDALRVHVVQDMSQGIRNSVNNMKKTMLEGSLLTILIVYLFLSSWRSTVITGLTLPIALIGSFYAMYVLGFTLNVMSLLALSLSVGILIDDAIVVRENIVRHITLGYNHREASLLGTQEITLAVVATTFTLVAVFLPVGFMGGIIGQFFLQFGVTVSVAVLLSLFVSFTLDPMLSSVWFDPSVLKPPTTGWSGFLATHRDAGMAWMSHNYNRLLQHALLWRKSTLAIALGLLISSFSLLPSIGVEFVPEADLNELMISLTTPVGSSLSLTEEKVRKVHEAIRSFPEVIQIYASINTGMAVGKNQATLFVTLVDRKERQASLSSIKQRIRERLKTIAGLEFYVGTPTDVKNQKPLQVSLQGPNMEILEDLNENVLNIMNNIPGMSDVESSHKEGKPTYHLAINRPYAHALGVSVPDIIRTLRPLLSGTTVTSWHNEAGEDDDIWVRLPESWRTNIQSLDHIQVRSASGALIPLSQVVDTSMVLGPQQINRRNLTREILLSASAQGVPVGDLGQLLKTQVRALDKPHGYRFVFEGATEDIKESAGYASTALLLGMILIYLILASLFNSFLQPLAIMCSLPLALIGVFLGLWTAGSTLNIFSAIGCIMLMGLVTKNAILLVDFINQKISEGLERSQAILAAGETRLRPILMTTLAMIFGMLPLALGLGSGSEQTSPMAHAVIGGLITSTLLTLVVVPVAYTYLDDWGRACLSYMTKSHPDQHAKPIKE